MVAGAESTVERDGSVNAIMRRLLRALGVPPATAESMYQMLAIVGAMRQQDRPVFFQVLTDHFCPRCGIEQPEGDCQCGREES